ncbi:DNA-binding Lrp family transcriptional regulator [Mycetocola sp. CAN_C7]|uniref:Lrp/AsnC family transcriptional regulator n=1 Tax=Mycetocola sp. CAN_C7 TaxID=2787724 RepID=UPI0018CB688C
MTPDALDVRLVTLLTDEPRIGVLEASRRLGVARATVQARLDKLVASGAVSSLGPQLDPTRFGFPVTAFVSLELTQSLGGPAARELESIPEVLEIHSVSGAADLLLRVVARSNDDLQRVLDTVLGVESVVRASSSIALTTFLDHRTLPAFAEAAR